MYWFVLIEMVNLRFSLSITVLDLMLASIPQWFAFKYQWFSFLLEVALMGLLLCQDIF